MLAGSIKVGGCCGCWLVMGRLLVESTKVGGASSMYVRCGLVLANLWIYDGHAWVKYSITQTVGLVYAWSVSGC